MGLILKQDLIDTRLSKKIVSRNETLIEPGLYTIESFEGILVFPTGQQALGTNEHFLPLEPFVTNIACLSSNCPVIDFIQHKNSVRAHGLVSTK